jgi:NADPH:quinone reductase-like Zn-dependent oxidoreductase
VVRGLPYVLRIMEAGLLKPKNGVPGTAMAGHVESVGNNVTRFRPGDEVFGERVRGHQWHNGGALAEYVSVPKAALAQQPAQVDVLHRASLKHCTDPLALEGLQPGDVDDLDHGSGSIGLGSS